MDLADCYSVLELGDLADYLSILKLGWSFGYQSTVNLEGDRLTKKGAYSILFVVYSPLLCTFLSLSLSFFFLKHDFFPITEILWFQLLSCQNDDLEVPLSGCLPKSVSNKLSIEQRAKHLLSKLSNYC